MSSNAPADAAFLKDLALPHVDAGGDFLIFGLPPAEVAVHEAEADSNGKHELYLICDDVNAFVEAMTAKSVACDPIAERGWGTVTSITLPSGQKLGVYQAHHARPAAKKSAAKALQQTAKAVRKATKKAKKVSKKETKKAAKATKKQTKKAAKATKKASKASKEVAAN